MENLQPLNVTYYTRNNYGNELKYPVSADAHVITYLSGSKTLTDSAIYIVTQYGRGAVLEEVLKPKEGE